MPPPQGHPSRLLVLGNLAVVLERLFDRTNDFEIVAEIGQIARERVNTARSMELSRLSASLTTLVNALISQYRISRKAPLLAEAVEAAREAVAVTLPGSPDRARVLNNLSGALMELFEQSGNATALDDAVRLSREAVAAVPSGDATNRALFVTNLLITLQAAHRRTGEVKILMEAAAVGRQALADVPMTGGAVQAKAWEALGDVLTALGNKTKDRLAIAEARNCSVKAAGALGAATITRIEAYRRLGREEMCVGSHEKALAAFESAVELVPQLAPRTLSRSNREHSLAQMTGLAAEAAAAAVAAGQPERAVELLEQTRGLLFGQTLDERSDLTDLSGVRPDLAAEFGNLRERIAALEAIGSERADSRFATSPHYEQRQRLAEQWTAVLDRIRAVPGFEEFLRPPPISRLRQQAEDGPIVVVFASRWRAGALIITPDRDRPVEVVPLPGLTEARAADRAAYLRYAREAATGPIADRAQAQREIHEVLAWTWDTITGPVLDHLGFAGQPEPLPRIWWCPVGALAYLPLHASGHHADLSGKRTVLDRAVSSYVITIRTLEHARARPAAPRGSAVIVAMPSTPGASDLPGVRDETAALARVLDSPLILTGPAATHEAATKALEEHSIAHFACHGVPDTVNPGGSRVLLHDHFSKPLTVSEIARLHLARADLAYLSACDTTQTNKALADEVLHLAAATHIAGYRHVIGTLWPVNDNAATRLAIDFYTQLTAGGTCTPDAESSAHALASAARRLRDEHPAIPTRWAAHMHFGT